MSENQEKQEKRVSKKTAHDKKMELAAERGRLVLIPTSGDEMFCLIFLLRQIDNAITRMNKGSRTYPDEVTIAFKKEVRELTDSCQDLAERACECVGFRFTLPAPLQKEKQSQNAKNRPYPRHRDRFQPSCNNQEFSV